MIRRLFDRLYHTGGGPLPNILSDPDSRRTLLQFTLFRQPGGPRPTSLPLIIRYPRRALWLTCNQNVQEHAQKSRDYLSRKYKQDLELQISANITYIAPIVIYYGISLSNTPVGTWLAYTCSGYNHGRIDTDEIPDKFCFPLSVKSSLLSSEPPDSISDSIFN